MKCKPGDIVRALRMPFLSASILPFVFGSLINKDNFNLPAFIFGLIAVISTHLSSNLINDCADSKSGVDWQDIRFFGLFGGSKLIQEKVFTEEFYFYLAVSFCLISGFSVLILAAIIKDLSVLGFFLVVIFLGWMYSHKPIQFSYRGLGEVIIFLLFGPALVTGGYFIQTGIFPHPESFVLSLPFGFFTTAVLFANELPDYREDKLAGKFNWVSFTGPNQAYKVYYLLMGAAFLAIIIDMAWGYINIFAVFSLVCIFPALKAAKILKGNWQDKIKLIQSSKLTIAVQALASLILIISLVL